MLRFGLVTQACQVAMWVRPFSLTICIRLTDVSVTSMVMSWLSELIGPYCPLRITELSWGEVEADISPTEVSEVAECTNL